MNENRKLKVFLCHSKDDKPKVRELYRRLVADGFDAWLDEEKLMPGQDWDLEIRKAVREADVVVVCLSNSSITKAGYVQKEIRFALDVADEQPEGAIFIIPARLEDCQVPKRLEKWQWVNLFEETGVKRLVHSLTLCANSVGILVGRRSYLSQALVNKQHIDIIEPILVKIPAGNFLMGSTKEQTKQAIIDGVGKEFVKREQPQHTVELSKYFIGKYPITNREYQLFVRDAKYNPPHGWKGDQFPAGKGRHPVVNVRWHDAIVYCRWLSEITGKQYRLPTEAEWEKAARGENGLVYPWGNDFDPNKANTREAKLGDTSEVGQFSPQGDSPYSCADMAGNVWEWCNDRFNEHEYKGRVDKNVKDPQGPQQGDSRVLRGSSFHNGYEIARCVYRRGNIPENFYYRIGFRIVVSPIKLESGE
ncbi:MAG TPA: SUMF1/EgtB/PvdO family nonheme iron enzyme [Rhabdochlamydiaceae bacterium]|nr:SUMF1/EgtB/PvdO family nonheme iron enzyme [Rhabdochlamydiaceae bacterium]